MSYISSLPISELAHDGRGIGFLPSASGRGKAVFVLGALPGQTVSCEITRARNNYLEAALKDILEEDASLLQPLCPHTATCGGCPLQRLPYEKQLFWKEKLAQSAFLRLGGLSAQTLAGIWSKPLPSPLLTGYRNKITLAFGEDVHGNSTIGFRERKSHCVTDLRSCVLMEPEALAIVEVARNLIRTRFSFPENYLRFLVLRKLGSLSDPAVRWHGLLLTGAGSRAQKKLVRDFGAELLAANASLAGFIHEERLKQDRLARGEKRICAIGDQSGTLAMELGGRVFGLDAASFFQVNGASANLLAQQVVSLDRETGPLLDIYSGVGAPGQLLASGHESCLGFELDPIATQCANGNAQRAGLVNWSYEAGDAAKKLLNLCAASKPGMWPAALVDPPRAGLAPEAARSLLKLAPRQILYVSCNAATMARDARTFAPDYSLVALRSVDMFPHTQHLECVGLFERR